MEELNLQDLFNYFVKKIPIIAFITIVVFLLGLYYLLIFKQPLYKGEHTLILVQDNSNSQLTQTDLNLNQKLVPTYSKILKSKKVINETISRLDLDMTYEELANKISITSESDNDVIKIVVSDRNAEEAATIANSVATVFKNEITYIYNLQNITTLDRAEVEDEPYNIHTIRDSIIFFVVGFILAIAIVFVIYYFDTSIKSSEELEEKLKITVLGSVPMYKRRKSA